LTNNLTGDGTTNCTHGTSTAGMQVKDGTEIAVHNNYFDGQGTAAGFLLEAAIASGSIIREWDNFYGANYSFKTRSLSTNGVVEMMGRPVDDIVPRTADTTCARYPMGTTFSNAGASAARTFSLPVSKPSMKYHFRVAAAQELRIDPAGTETIAIVGTQQAAGLYITADAVGEFCTLECVVAGRWEQTNYYGTWTVEP
jgi:hypothetical protein